MNEKLNEIKSIIIEELEKENIKVHKIILFGSRARGDFKEDSDWDFYVIIDKNLDFHKKWKIIKQIQKKILEIDEICDIIITSEKKFFEDIDNVGKILYYAVREGIEI